MTGGRESGQPLVSVLVTSPYCAANHGLSSDRFSVRTGHSEHLSAGELRRFLAGADAVVCTLNDRFDTAVFAEFPRLKLVANAAVGYDNIDLEAATASGVLVANTPGVLDETVADLTFALILASARRLGEAERYLRAGRWDGFRMNLLLGLDVHGKTLGLLGCGRIGQRVAHRARGFSMRLLYHKRKRFESPDESRLQIEYVTMDDLLRQSDFLCLLCPLTSDTRHLIGARELSLMKPTAFLINTSRGPVVDENALSEALRTRRIRGAGLDVFEREPLVSPELLEMENVVLVPHLGSATVETRQAMIDVALGAVKSAFQGTVPNSCLNPGAWDSFCKRAASDGLIPWR